MRLVCPRRRPQPIFNTNQRRKVSEILKGLNVQQLGKTTAACSGRTAICSECALEIEAEIATLTIRHAVRLDVLLTLATRFTVVPSLIV